MKNPPEAQASTTANSESSTEVNPTVTSSSIPVSTTSSDSSTTISTAPRSTSDLPSPSQSPSSTSVELPPSSSQTPNLLESITAVTTTSLSESQVISSATSGVLVSTTSRSQALPTVSPTASPTSAASSPSFEPGFGTVQIVGTAAGGTAFLAVLAAVIFVLMRRRRRYNRNSSDWLRREDHGPQPTLPNIRGGHISSYPRETHRGTLSDKAELHSDSTPVPTPPPLHPLRQFRSAESMKHNDPEMYQMSPSSIVGLASGGSPYTAASQQRTMSPISTNNHAGYAKFSNEQSTWSLMSPLKSTELSINGHEMSAKDNVNGLPTTGQPHDYGHGAHQIPIRPKSSEIHQRP